MIQPNKQRFKVVSPSLDYYIAFILACLSAKNKENWEYVQLTVLLELT